MKVIMLKSHEDYRSNDEVEIDEGIANYWIFTGVAVAADSVEKPDNEAIEKELTTKLKTAKPLVKKKVAKK